jgi:GPH family glycoside/pentoside/hexuronide:cation symporter
LPPFGSFGNGVALVLLVLTIMGVGLGAATAYLIPWSLLPDAIDADPDKPAGLYTAWMVIIQKIGIGFSVFMLGNGLSLSGYRAAAGMVFNIQVAAELTKQGAASTVGAAWSANGEPKTINTYI